MISLKITLYIDTFDKVVKKGYNLYLYVCLRQKETYIYMNICYTFLFTINIYNQLIKFTLNYSSLLLLIVSISASN